MHRQLTAHATRLPDWLTSRWNGWKLAGALAPVTYLAWALWLIVTGIALLIWSTDGNNPLSPQGRAAAVR